ncbi:MAG: PucR family transcriptional regulator [Stackebrandtia sp.]
MRAIDSLARTVEEILRRLRPKLPELFERMTQRRFAEIPMYAAGAAGSWDDVWRSVEANTHDAFSRLTGENEDLTAAKYAGRTRAQQGVPLADILTSFRMGYDEVWEAMVAETRIEPALDPEAVVDLSTHWFRLHNVVGDTLIHAYREESQRLLLTRERERAALIDVLMSHDVGVATVVEVAEMLRLPLEGVFVVVAAATKLGQDPIPGVDSYLAAIDVSSVWQLKQDALVGVLSLGKAERNEPALEVLARHAAGPVGVSPVFLPLRRTYWALGLAQLVLERHSGSQPVEQFQDNPMNVLVASAPGAAQETSRVVLGTLLDLPADRRDLLLQTFNAWVEAGGSARTTGEVLNCHPNTIRHRLRRIELSTSRSLTHPGDVAELVAACRAWAQLPPAAD